jgi:Flp pilus assembly pilin Flp
MKLPAHLGRVLADDYGGGGAVLGYALVAGLIIVGVIALLTSVGNNVLACWTSLDGSP